MGIFRGTVCGYGCVALTAADNKKVDYDDECVLVDLPGFLFFPCCRLLRLCCC